MFKKINTVCVKKNLIAVHIIEFRFILKSSQIDLSVFALNVLIFKFLLQINIRTKFLSTKLGPISQFVVFHLAVHRITALLRGRESNEKRGRESNARVPNNSFSS